MLQAKLNKLKAIAEGVSQEPRGLVETPFIDFIFKLSSVL